MEKKEPDKEIEILDFDSNINEPKEKQNNPIEKKDKTNNKEVKKETIKKTSNKTRGLIIAIIIFIMLAALIYFLPNINSYILSNNSAPVNDTTSGTTKKYTSGIDLNKIINSIKEDKNYIYEENIEINTIDKKNNPQRINTNLIYHFNPNKFQIDISKTIGDYNEVSYEYYEKTDDIYKKYLYDVTTKKINTLNTDSTEFNNIFDIYTKIIDNLLNNMEIVKEDLIKTEEGESILIQTKNNKNLFELLSYKTDRINSLIDINEIDDGDVIINYFFNKNKELNKIEFELETINAYKEDNINEVTSININFSFRDFNTVKDILIPTE